MGRLLLKWRVDFGCNQAFFDLCGSTNRLLLFLGTALHVTNYEVQVAEALLKTEKSSAINFPSPDQINVSLVVPEHDSATPVKPSEALFIYNFLKQTRITSTLEIGFAYGRSAAHIVSATQSLHHVIDPFQQNYDNLGMKNMQHLGIDSLVKLHPDFSHSVLPEMVNAGQKFDFIFIDGDHKFDGIFVDFYYADFLANEGGYILFHDTWMRSTQLVMSFIDKNRKDFKRIDTPLRNIALYQKTGTDNRNGMHFKGFYTFKSLFVHHLIIWMSEGEMTPLKKLLLKLKDLVK